MQSHNIIQTRINPYLGAQYGMNPINKMISIVIIHHHSSCDGGDDVPFSLHHHLSRHFPAINKKWDQNKRKDMQWRKRKERTFPLVLPETQLTFCVYLYTSIRFCSQEDLQQNRWFTRIIYPKNPDNKVVLDIET